ncbi:hypothetical protein A0H81_05096 [Grifola frondosa]|uniref:Exonuclease domain-containing protein n=1 Tax=Grifola frondosa TaxID=5627 RepID=A0A1C7MCH3_GRIFR|nr:hypothetical protein A0H81_05096 [Grifola frondosa]
MLCNVVTSEARSRLRRSSSSLSDGDGVATQESGFGESSGGGGWTKVEKRKAKKSKKTEVKHDINPPRFMYVKGEILRRRETISISDIRDLVLHLSADAPPPSWVRVENPHSVHKVVALLIPGLTPDILSLPPLPTSATDNPNLPLAVPLPAGSSSEASHHAVPFVSSTFSHACPTRAPGDQTRMHSVLNAFFQGPVSGEEKKKRLLERVTSERAQEKSPMRYLLNVEQMVENEYPIPSYLAEVFEKSSDWVETTVEITDLTLLSPPIHNPPRIFAIDCEMCLTEDGKELARICMIDYVSDIVVYDKLVKPRKPIVDYLTRWSGITAEALDPVTTTFEEVQTHVHSILSVSPTPILTLRLFFTTLVDDRSSLGWHGSQKNDLLKKKVQNGPGFGEFKIDTESIFERMSRSRSETVTSAVVDHGNPAAWHGSKATTTIACKSDAEVLEGLLSAMHTHSFVFGRFTALADALGWITSKSSGDAAAEPVVAAAASSERDTRAVLASLNSQLQQLYAALPPRTALIIFTGHSDPRRMAELNARKATFENALRSGKTLEDVGKESRWTSADGRELEEEVEKAKRGLLFLGVKTAS